MKKQNSITTAPQIENAFSVLPIWLSTHTGTMNDFPYFMTTPSVERTAFLAEYGQLTITGDAASMTIKE